jgi:hypothetical protein
MSDAQIAMCFEYVAEDAPIDLDKLFSQGAARKAKADGEEIREPRSGA